MPALPNLHDRPCCRCPCRCWWRQWYSPHCSQLGVAADMPGHNPAVSTSRSAAALLEAQDPGGTAGVGNQLDPQAGPAQNHSWLAGAGPGWSGQWQLWDGSQLCSQLLPALARPAPGCPSSSVRPAPAASCQQSISSLAQPPPAAALCLPAALCLLCCVSAAGPAAAQQGPMRGLTTMASRPGPTPIHLMYTPDSCSMRCT